MNNDQVTFEFTLDELVAFQVDLMRSTGVGSSWKRIEQWKFAASFIVVISAFLVLVSSDRSPSVIIFLIAVAAVIGALITPLFGRYYDQVIKTRMRKLLIEQLGSSGPYTCSIELRQESLSAKQMNVEMNFSWRDAMGIDDVSDGVMVRFKGGRALARSRGFTSPEHRSAFLARARELMAANNGR